MDLASLMTITGASVLLMLVMTFLKRYVSRTDLIPYITLGVGIAIPELAALGSGHLTSVGDVITYLFIGITVGLGATGTYEATLDKLFPTVPPPVIPEGIQDGHRL